MAKTINMISILVILMLTLLPFSTGYSHPELYDDSVSQYLDTLYEEFKDTEIPKEYLKKYRFILPVSLKLVITDTNEVRVLEVNKQGKFKLSDDSRRGDVEIQINEETFFEIVSQKSFELEQIKHYVEIEKVIIIPHSLKAQIAAQILKEKYGLEITKKKTIRSSTLAFIIAKFVSMFIKQDG